MRELALRFPGQIGVRIGFNETDARRMFAGSDFLLMPSRYEPCGLSQMYAQRFGSLPVARNTGGLADTIEDGVTGFLVPLQATSASNFEPLHPAQFQADLAAKLNELLDHPELAKKMGAESRKRAVGVFSWKSIANQTLDFYQHVASRYKKEGARGI